MKNGRHGELIAYGAGAALALGAGLAQLGAERVIDLDGAAWLLFALASATAALRFGIGAGLVCTLLGALISLVVPLVAGRGPPSTGAELAGLLLFVVCGVLASVVLGLQRGARAPSGSTAGTTRGERAGAAESDARLLAMLDTAVEGIISIDERGTVESFNPAAERLFGYTAAEAIGRNVTLLMPPPYREAHDGYLDAYRSTGIRKIIGIGREVNGRRKDGSVFPMDLSVGEVVVGGRRIFTGFVRDISERKRLEQEVVQAQKLEAVGTLANGIAHDFNNVLMGILACSRVACRDLQHEPAAVELFTEIGDAASRGIALTRQLLSFSRGGSGTLVPTRIDAVIEKNQTMMRQLLGEDVALRIELSARGAHVMGDEGLLEQVLINLLVNARDALPRGGEIAVTTAESRDRSPEVVLEVRDSGCGMPPEVLARIFEPFFTTKGAGKGTGLGLSTVKRIVAQLGGRIEVETDVGRGSCFRLSFPLSAPPAGTIAPVQAAGRAKPEGVTLLLVEDDRLVRTAVRRFLEGKGFNVLAADGPSEAVTAACANPRIDVLLTDMILPGSGGNELAQEIQARVPGLRVVFMSAHSAEFLAEQQRLKPGDCYLQKPFELEELMQVLSAVLEPVDRARGA